MPETTNRLGAEKSPYLLQHAHNPVDWYPWGAEAFEKAEREDKPIFLSIGYSTCHWCHVMAHESFEDPEVAQMMNEAFVCIKVDREERPDIDGIYMTICQMLTGSGGWPLTIVMTPDKQPFFAATYIPKTSRYGRTGMLDLIPRIQELWTTRRGELLESADRITNALREAPQDAPGQEPDAMTMQQAYRQLAERFDALHGGFGDAPKFPTPHNLLFLLRYWKRTGEGEALAMVEQTLEAMRLGGVYDHVGFGFHRYSTDRHWLLPHFEKMLYDQALMLMAYVEAYQATGKATYAETAQEIVAYVLRDMTSPEGGFYSAEDADSEGEEGKFYVWTEEELQGVLGEEDAGLLIDLFNVEPDGNFLEEATRERTGANILHLRKPVAELAEEIGLAEPALRERLEAARQKLFTHREGRIHPHKDDKVLTDWNGLMIAALAKAAQAFDLADYANAASRAADFILTTMRSEDGRLVHRYRDGEAGLPAHVDDYAFLIWGLLELYEAAFEVRYLQAALDLNEELLEHFWDGENGGFYVTASDAEELLIRQKEIYDGATPSGNSVAMWNLLRLARITANPDLEEKAVVIGRAFSGQVRRAPLAYTQLLVALDFAIGPSYEVVIVGEPHAEDTQAMLRALRAPYVPNKVVILRPAGQAEAAITRIAEFTRQHTSIDGKPTAYVCQNTTCKLPTTSLDEMLALLEA
jgi:uncharacterized protein YyaL (SSP411 family)